MERIMFMALISALLIDIQNIGIVWEIIDTSILCMISCAGLGAIVKERISDI